jgi:uncharacterized protein YhhL (DUF1145 family)
VIDSVRKTIRVCDSGILAISTVSIIQFLQLGVPLPFPLNVSLYGFAVAMTSAGMQVLLLTVEEGLGSKSSLGQNAHIALVACAGGTFFLGTLYLIAYLSFAAAATFVVTSSVTYALVFLIIAPTKLRYRVSIGAGVVVLIYGGAMLVLSYYLPANPIYQLVHFLP